MAVGGKGRQLKYGTAESLMDKGMEYVNSRTEAKKPVLYSGLLLHIDLSRDAFNDYAKREKYEQVVFRLKSYVQKDYEELLHSGKPVGAIFALKQFGWNGDGEVTSAPSVVINWGKQGKKRG